MAVQVLVGGQRQSREQRPKRDDDGCLASAQTTSKRPALAASTTTFILLQHPSSSLCSLQPACAVLSTQTTRHRDIQTLQHALSWSLSTAIIA